MSKAFSRGEQLQARREQLGLSTDEVFRKLRIPPVFIEAIEKGDLHNLPAPCYTAGFVRTYCEFLGLDPQPYTNSIEMGGNPMRSLFRLHRSKQSAFPSWLGELAAWAAVCAIFLLGWFAYTAIVRPKAELTDGRVEAGVVHRPGHDAAAPR